jgi:hypothetical protein
MAERPERRRLQTFREAVLALIAGAAASRRRPMIGVGRSVVSDEGLESNPERPSQFGEAKQADVELPAFNTRHVTAIHMRGFCQGLLRHLPSISGIQQAFSDSF